MSVACQYCGNYGMEHSTNCPNAPSTVTRATADEAASGLPSDLTPETNHLARGWLSEQHKKITIELARKARQDWLSAPDWARKHVLADEADRAEKEPKPARWKLEPQGVDVEGLRAKIKDVWAKYIFDNDYSGKIEIGPNELHALLNELERLRREDEARNASAFAMGVAQESYQRRAETAEARVAELEEICNRAEAEALSYATETEEFKIRVAELEQRLRIAADPDGEEREALRARVEELEELEAKVERVREWAEKGITEANGGWQYACEDLCDTILNGGTE